MLNAYICKIINSWIYFRIEILKNKMAGEDMPTFKLVLVGDGGTGRLLLSH